MRSVGVALRPCAGLTRWGHARVCCVAAAAMFVFVTLAGASPAVALPVSTPTITSPADVGVVAGIIDIAATTSATSVQFYVDAVPLGAPVAAVSGTATTLWETWGLDTSASYVLTASDCDIDGCGSASSPVEVTLDVVAPVLTAPTASKNVESKTTFTATAGGGSVAFSLDGVQAGVDTVAPFTW